MITPVETIQVVVQTPNVSPPHAFKSNEIKRLFQAIFDEQQKLEVSKDLILNNLNSSCLYSPTGHCRIKIAMGVATVVMYSVVIYGFASRSSPFNILFSVGGIFIYAVGAAAATYIGIRVRTDIEIMIEELNMLITLINKYNEALKTLLEADKTNNISRLTSEISTLSILKEVEDLSDSE